MLRAKSILLDFSTAWAIPWVIAAGFGFGIAATRADADPDTGTYAQVEPAGPDTNASEASVVKTGTGYLLDQTFGISPEIGAFAFKDSNDSQASRGAAGLAFDFNLAHLAAEAPPRLYAGISTGALYTHVGGPDANFFGYNSTAATSDVVVIPADFKLGYAFTDTFRLGIHGGANAVWSSQPGTVQLGNLDHWNVFPNAGADIDFGFAPQIAVGIRPDFTFTPQSDFFTGTVEVGYVFG